MKRINQWSYMLLSAILFAACSQEITTDTEITNEKPMTTVGLKVCVDTDNADGTQVKTRVGGDNSIPAGYQLRHIVEVYVGDQKLPVTREVRTSTSYDDFSFEGVRLPVGNKYKAVFWTDLVAEGGQANLYYNADKLQKITQTPSGCVNMDLLDAYTGQMTFAVGEDGKVTSVNDDPDKTDLLVTLTRPLVRINLKDIVLKDAVNGDYAISYQEGAIPTSYNAFTRKVLTTTTRTKGATVSLMLPAMNAFTLKDYIFMDETARSLNVVVTNGSGTDYGVGNHSLHIQLSVPNMDITVKSENGNLSLETLTHP